MPLELLMAWPNPFQKQTPLTQNAWGHRFELSPLHLSPAEMDPMKHSYDRLGEEAYHILNDITQTGNVTPDAALLTPSLGPDKAPARAKKDLYVLLRDNATKNTTLTRLWNEANSVPPWVNWDQIAKGQECFYRYGGAVLTGLAFHSLLGGMVRFYSLIGWFKKHK